MLGSQAKRPPYLSIPAHHVGDNITLPAPDIMGSQLEHAGRIEQISTEFPTPSSSAEMPFSFWGSPPMPPSLLPIPSSTSELAPDERLLIMQRRAEKQAASPDHGAQRPSTSSTPDHGVGLRYVDDSPVVADPRRRPRAVRPLRRSSDQAHSSPSNITHMCLSQ